MSTALTHIPTADMNYPSQSVPTAALVPQHAVHSLESLNPQTAPINHLSKPGLAVAPQSAITTFGQPTPQVKDKFQTKSTVWTDTLNRGLVNLNIIGAKNNPLVDIGIDFDSINRMEKRKEKSSAASMITLGKAMGSRSGSGGRASAGGLAPPSSPMTGSGIGMSGANGMEMGRGMGVGIGVAGVGGYGGCMNQQMADMGMNQGAPMRPSAPASSIPGVGQNSTGVGGYAMRQQHYGGGYR